MDKLRVFTAFSGYDSQCMALDRLGIEYNLVGWSEIDKYAIQAHNAVYPQWADRNYGDISKIDWASVPDFDLFTMSPPCTDFSIIGKQLGGEEGSGTRSSLLWECRKAITIKRPKYIVFENVKNLVGNKFIHLFNIWKQELERLGYSNFSAVLNAKDYGVPQNRERVFMVSILGSSDFAMPTPIPLNKSIRNILDANPRKDLFLSKTLKAEHIDECKFVSYTRDKNGKVVKRSLRDVSNTVHTSTGGGGNTDMFIIVPNIVQVANIAKEGSFKNPQIGRVYSVDGISPTLLTMQGGGRQPMIIEPNMFASELDTEEMGEEPLNDVCVDIEYKGRILRDGDGLYLHNSKDFDNGALSGISRTLKATKFDAGVVQNYRIRKLTEREVFRLMGVIEADIDKIQKSGVSKTQQYKMAGNSIVVDVLYHIFRKLFIEKENENNQLTLF